MKLKAEIIAIGDELTSGQRLDTNSQWLSQQLGDLGIEVAFHTTVGDDLEDNTNVFRIASERAKLVLVTGGLGPTADDLTRQAIADAAKVELVFHEETLEHIQEIFRRFGREMPENNRIQAYFPKGARVIDNPEGTAPGIDFDFPVDDVQGHSCRVFALPGVPAEMKQMWEFTVCPAIHVVLGESKIIHHHVIHCFGVGESQTEKMLPDLIRRGREPRVGITASAATISLRITARDESLEACLQQMEPTIEAIHQNMGQHVFGQNGQTLEECVGQLLSSQERSVAIFDAGLQGDVGSRIFEVANHHLNGASIFKGCLSIDESSGLNWLGVSGEKLDDGNIQEAARRVAQNLGSDIGVAISALHPPTKTNSRPFYVVGISDGEKTDVTQHFHGGHSSFRHVRSVKQVLNHLRLFLLDQD